VRPDTLQRFPGAREALLALANTLSDSEMRKMNFQVDVNHRDIADVAREFLRAKGLE
jgi:glycine betaine/choline ABC-type transport system substrate-binding protein